MSYQYPPTDYADGQQYVQLVRDAAFEYVTGKLGCLHDNNSQVTISVGIEDATEIALRPVIKKLEGDEDGQQKISQLIELTRKPPPDEDVGTLLRTLADLHGKEYAAELAHLLGTFLKTVKAASTATGSRHRAAGRQAVALALVVSKRRLPARTCRHYLDNATPQCLQRADRTPAPTNGPPATCRIAPGHRAVLERSPAICLH